MLAQMKSNPIRILILLALFLTAGVARSAEELPARLSDDAFWKMVTEYSEPGGSFLSDNFVSNELAFQDVLPELTGDRKTGGVYLGVGPEQNFTYIAALKPKIAFIFDIRRQNLIEHLMYKALFELSSDRVDFLSRLLSRPRPADAGKDTSIEVLTEAFRETPAESSLYEENLQSIENQLIKKHGFALTSDDQTSLRSILTAFYIAGVRLTYAGPRTINTIMPTYEAVLTDTDNKGIHRSYMATEESFLTIQQFEKNNLLVPIVGDFGGPSAIRSVGAYLKEHGATVTAFYTSNVEQYLFMGDSWKKFYANVAALPLDKKSVFIRPLINVGTGAYSASPLFRPGFWWDTKLFPMADLVDAFNAGMIQGYYDIIGMPN
jgi:hypothetical protein